MREIKFRGQRLDNGEWVEGWAVDTCYGLSIVTEPLYHIDGAEWNVLCHQIDPKTIVSLEITHNIYENPELAHPAQGTDKGEKK